MLRSWGHPQHTAPVVVCRPGLVGSQQLPLSCSHSPGRSRNSPAKGDSPPLQFYHFCGFSCGQNECALRNANSWLWPDSRVFPLCSPCVEGHPASCEPSEVPCLQLSTSQIWALNVKQASCFTGKPYWALFHQNWLVCSSCLWYSVWYSPWHQASKEGVTPRSWSAGGTARWCPGLKCSSHPSWCRFCWRLLGMCPPQGNHLQRAAQKPP